MYLCQDGTMCNCGHGRNLHALSLNNRLLCLYRDPKTDEPCQCNDFTITLRHLPKRLTAEDIVKRMQET